jgi:multidrug efflux pump subunit AcrA (membrane-fusion protein)
MVNLMMKNSRQQVLMITVAVVALLLTCSLSPSAAQAPPVETPPVSPADVLPTETATPELNATAGDLSQSSLSDVWCMIRTMCGIIVVLLCYQSVDLK